MLSNWKKLYQTCLHQLNAPSNTNVARLKGRPKENVRGLTARIDFNEKVVIVFQDNLGDFLILNQKTPWLWQSRTS